MHPTKRELARRRWLPRRGGVRPVDEEWKADVTSASPVGFQPGSAKSAARLFSFDGSNRNGGAVARIARRAGQNVKRGRVEPGLRSTEFASSHFRGAFTTMRFREYGWRYWKDGIGRRFPAALRPNLIRPWPQPAFRIGWHRAPARRAVPRSFLPAQDCWNSAGASARMTASRSRNSAFPTR